MGVNYNPAIVTNGLVMYVDAANPKSYPGSGTTWTDLSRNGNNGTLTGVTYTGTPAYMEFASVSSSTVSFGNKLNYITGAFSFSYWIYLNSYSTNQAGQGPIPFFKGAYQQNGYYNQITSSGAIGFTTNQNGADQVTGTPNIVPLNTWMNICITRSGATVVIYANGVRASPSSATHINPSNSNENFRVGSYGQTSGGTYNIYGNVRISNFNGYNIALSAEQVTQNFNALRGRYGI